MSGLQLQDPSHLILTAQWHLNLVTYIEACSYVILYYDYLLTLNDEINQFWRRPKRSLAAILFFLNRYVVILGYIPYFIIFVYPNWFLQNEMCPSLIGAYYQFHVAFTHVVIAVLLVVRTSALYGNDRRIRFPLIGLVIAIIINGVVLLTALNTSTPVASESSPHIKLGCHSLYTQFQGIRMASVWAGLLVLDSVVFVLTTAKTYKLLQDCPWSTTLWTAFMRDGAIYFGQHPDVHSRSPDVKDSYASIHQHSRKYNDVPTHVESTRPFATSYASDATHKKACTTATVRVWPKAREFAIF